MNKSKSLKSTVAAVAAVLAVGALSIAAVVMQNNNNLEFHNFSSLQELEAYGSNLSKSDINSGIFAVNNVVYENIGGKWMATSRTVNTYGGISIGKDGKDGKDGVSAYSLASDSGFTGSEDEFVDVLLSFAQNNTDDAYEVFVNNGFTGSKDEFNSIIAALNGKDGVDGKDGRDGIDGYNGRDGANGTNGINGKNGTNGKNGADGKDGSNGVNGTNGSDGKDGLDGKDGKNGLDGIDGIDGKDGLDGKSAYEIFASQGFNGSETDFINTLFAAAVVEGSDDITEILTNYGFSGNAADVMAAMKGDQGEKGDTGTKGETGDRGSDGTSSVLGDSGTIISLDDGYWSVDNTQTAELARGKELSIDNGYFYVEDDKKGEATVNNADISALNDTISIVYEDGTSTEILDASNVKDMPASLSSDGSVITYSKDGQETELFDIKDYIPEYNSTNLEITDANGTPMTTAVVYDVIIGNNGNFWKYNYSTQAYEDTGTQAAGVDGVDGYNGISVGTIFNSEADIPERIKAYCTQAYQTDEIRTTTKTVNTTSYNVVTSYSYTQSTSTTVTRCGHNGNDGPQGNSWAITEAEYNNFVQTNGGESISSSTNAGKCSQCSVIITVSTTTSVSKTPTTYNYGYTYTNPYTNQVVDVPLGTNVSTVPNNIPSKIDVSGDELLTVHKTTLSLNDTQLQKLKAKGIISTTTDADTYNQELYNKVGTTKWIYCGTTS